jgi:hypothetical protein
MIMEPMAGVTAENREREERGKFKAGLKSGRASGSQGMKRKREDGEDETKLCDREDGDAEGAPKRKKSYGKGPKGPNPLAVKSRRNGLRVKGSRHLQKQIRRSKAAGLLRVQCLIQLQKRVSNVSGGENISWVLEKGIR